MVVSGWRKVMKMRSFDLQLYDKSNLQSSIENFELCGMFVNLWVCLFMYISDLARASNKAEVSRAGSTHAHKMAV